MRDEAPEEVTFEQDGGDEHARVLESPCRFSESVVWEMQRRYFETAGPTAWSDDVVPYYVTTNAYIARCYAHVIAAWIEDLIALGADHRAGGIDWNEPIHVIELGAGTGKLSFLLSHELAILSEERRLPPFRVVGTDFAEANVERWQSHPDLREAFAAGRLDGAMFDADEPAPLKLARAGTTLGPEPLCNPVVAVLNYVVDSLRQDAFRIQNGKLHEITAQAVMPSTASRDEHAPDATIDVQIRKGIRSVELPFYDDASLDGLLSHYVETLEDTDVLIPIGTLRALRYLRGLAGGRFCVLAGDKGFRRASDLDGRRFGGLVKSGAFSFMANFDAIASDLGGIALTHENQYSRFTVAAYSTVHAESSRFRGAYREWINEFGPAEYNRLFKLARASWEDAPIALVLLLLRLSGYDPGVFVIWHERILDAATEVGTAIRRDIALCLEQVLARTYAVAPRDDIRFSAGRIYYRLGCYPEAARQFERVLADTPERSAAWYNLGLCAEREGDLPQAREHYRRAIQLDPDYARAQKALARVDA